MRCTRRPAPRSRAPAGERSRWADEPLTIDARKPIAGLPTIVSESKNPNRTFPLEVGDVIREAVHWEPAGEAKFWIEPAVELHANYGLQAKRLAEAEKLIEEHVNEIRDAWAKHFPG